MMLRQYFLSLKVLGKWKHWGNSLGQHWDKIQTNLHDTHPIKESNPDGHDDLLESGYDTHDEDDTGTEGNKSSNHSTLTAQEERSLAIKRKVMKKWRRLARLTGHPELCDEKGVGEFTVNWTKVRLVFLHARLTSPHADVVAGHCSSVGEKDTDCRST